MEDALHQSNVFKSIIYPQYNPVSMENDFALLLIENQLKVTANLLPVCLPALSEGVTLPLTATLIGYEASGESTRMRAAQVNVVSREKCLDTNNVDFYWEHLLGNKFCAGSTLHEICSNDLGGGLFDKSGDSWVLLGINSMVNRQMAENSCKGSVIVTDIRRYVPWIAEVLNEQYF